MRVSNLLWGLQALAAAAAAVPLLAACNGDPVPNHTRVGRALFASPQANPVALSPDGARLYVANTTSHSVSVIDTAAEAVVAEVKVGLDPVGVAVRPDGNEVWVANHVSDSLSVIDSAPASPTLHQVIATVQDFDADGATRFDEPVGIAFASNSKAYVALSSSNRIAIVEPAAGGYAVSGELPISAQDPRAIAVKDGRLYVVAFESGNQTEISACPSGNSPPQCTVSQSDIQQFANSPNLPGIDKHIVSDSQLPDRDLFVFDTSDDAPFGSPVEGLGTLLYGLAVDGTGRVFVSNTEARNAENGMEGDSLADLQNRIFLNRITRVVCGGGGCSAGSMRTIFELEDPPGTPVAEGDQLATPYAIAISDDDAVAVATAAASSRIFTFDTATGAVRGRADVGAIPRGLALASDPVTGAPETAWVLNALDNSVTVVDVSNPDSPSVGTTIPVGDDATPDEVRRGRIAFNDAEASTSGTFACASCHPDGNTDQLMWRIGGACSASLDPACGGDEPRLTMPIRGLAHTVPLHWDGTLGDPFGGPNGAVGVGGSGGADCDALGPDGEHDCFADLVDNSLAGVMCDQSGACPLGGNNDLGPGDRDDMAHFLAGVSYPPARSRRMDDSISTSAREGFEDFFMDQGGIANFVGVASCADADSGCHALPLGTSTNSSRVGAFEAPTLRGMTDRFVHFSLGHTTTRENLLDLTAWNPASDPLDEKISFEAAFPISLAGFTDAYNVLSDDLFQMFEEASTGPSGATGRQVTLSSATLAGAALAPTLALLDELEAADARGAINLQGGALWNGQPLLISYRADEGEEAEHYRVADELRQPGQWELIRSLTRAELEEEAQAGRLVVTLTGHLPTNVGGPGQGQPLLATVGTGSGDTGNPPLPHLTGGSTTLSASVRDLRNGFAVYVDGQPAGASFACTAGSFETLCGQVEITLDQSPADGTHRLQVQNRGGLQSNELPICVGPVAGCL